MNVARILFTYNVVTWRPYHNKHEGPVQCTNCQNWQHGAFGCHRKPKCRVCAEEHKTANCPLLIEKRKNNNEKIHPSVLKCASCNGNHTANYSNCIKKPIYTPKPSRGSQLHQEPPLVNSREQFPPINNNHHSIHQKLG